jgi:glycosidase
MNKWYESAVFYHIYPLGLCGAPKENIENEVVHRLQELEEWIPHIDQLGCTAIYIGPLFESVGHGYETTDYKKVDRRLGSNDDFKHFVKQCHEYSIKVIVDGVFNHTGREFFAFQDLLANREQSHYLDWYCNVDFHGNNEYNDGFRYEAWGGYNILAKLNQKNIEVKQYLFDVIRFWANEFEIDGIRLDAADVLDFDFMKEMRVVANSISDEFWMMGEVIHGDYSRWANESTLHSVTNYELHKGLYSGHNDHNYFEIAHTVKRLFDSNGGICKDSLLYTFVDNHDVERIASKLLVKQHLIPLYLLLYSLPGIPSLYYGSEFALEGKKERNSDDTLRPNLELCDYLPVEGREYEGIYNLLAKLGEAKKKYKELTYGRSQELLLTNRQYAYARTLDESAVITVVNNDDNQVYVTIPLPMQVNTAIDAITGEEIIIINRTILVNLNENSGTMIQISNI